MGHVVSTSKRIFFAILYFYSQLWINVVSLFCISAIYLLFKSVCTGRLKRATKGAEVGVLVWLGSPEAGRTKERIMDVVDVDVNIRCKEPYVHRLCSEA